MKLAIIGWRPWTVAQRYKSLIVNAKNLGHKVVGVALEHCGDRPMTASLFQALGAPVRSLRRFKPDAVFGECFWNAEEKSARAWARRAGKKYFVLDHGKMLEPRLSAYNNNKPPSITFAVNEKNADLLNRKFGVQAVVVGYPNFDIDYEVDVAKTREGLGIDDQPMVALFLGVTHRPSQLERERERLFSFLALAQEKDWKVFMHLHPGEQGRKFRYLDRGRPRRAFLKELQDREAIFVSCFPGNYNDIIFKDCGPMALMRSADLVGGTYKGVAPMFQAYVAAKNYFWMGDGEWPSIRHPNLVVVDSDYKGVTEAIEENTGSFEQDPAYMKRWFYKVDGQVWRRILDAVRA